MAWLSSSLAAMRAEPLSAVEARFQELVFEPPADLAAQHQMLRARGASLAGALLEELGTATAGLPLARGSAVRHTALCASGAWRQRPRRALVAVRHHEASRYDAAEFCRRGYLWVRPWPPWGGRVCRVVASSRAPHYVSAPARRG